MNILRAIRRQIIVNRAYSNGYEQGRFDALMDIACGEAPCPAHPAPPAGHADRARDEEAGR